MQTNKEIWIFLSHSSKDYDKVRLIRNYLEEKSFRPLMFYLKCLDSDEETYNLITREIDVRTRFILCDSPNARASEWVKKEMDYITSDEHKRSYEVLDLSEPIERLQAKLDTYTNKTNVYISYCRTDKQLCDYICKRLSKYDLNVWCDFLVLEKEQDFAKEIKKNIQHAANNGYFVALCSNDYLDSAYCQQELQYAKEIGANIISVPITKDSYDNVEDIEDDILQKLLPSGTRKTFAENFRIGKFSKVDVEESDRLYRRLIEEAENSPNPHALKFIGECYEYGRGVEIDLYKASVYYSEYIHHPEINYKVDDAFLEHVRALNNQLYGSVNQS